MGDETRCRSSGALRPLAGAEDPLLWGASHQMNVLVIEPNATARAALAARLTDLGIGVASFQDPYVAFLFLVGRLEEVDGVLVNSDDELETSRLLRRLEVLPAPVAVVTYSGRDPERAAVMAAAGRPERYPVSNVMRRTEDVCLSGGGSQR